MTTAEFEALNDEERSLLAYLVKLEEEEQKEEKKLNSKELN